MAKQEDAVFKARIDAMFHRDCLFGWIFVAWLWVTYLFVYWAITSRSPVAGSGGIQVALIVAGLAVCIYNTASIGAMVKHYSEDRHFIYSVDLRHLDLMRELKQKKYQEKAGGK